MIRKIVGYDDELSNEVSFVAGVNIETIEVKISSCLIGEESRTMSVELSLVDMEDLIEWLKSEVELIKKLV